ncbi:MAG: hypothetical protein HOH33_17520 [Verrucomicrobia bacterium]|jgi:hypothetical protein|nr:hypothetical protein [Verrucomicrobiota bacterium]
MALKAFIWTGIAQVVSAQGSDGALVNALGKSYDLYLPNQNELQANIYRNHH